MDFQDLYNKLNIKLGDNDNFAFTQEEKEEFITEAIEDSYVVKTVRDVTLTYSLGTSRYAVPTALTTVKDISIKYGDYADPEPIALPWEVVDRYIEFKGGSSALPDGTTLYIRGNYKYTIADTIAETNLQQYVLNLAQINAMDGIGIKKILKFVKNDMTVSEMMAVKSNLERKTQQQRLRLPREFQSA